MKHLLSFIILIGSLSLQATHNRAGEITFTWKSGFTYEVTITTYTREDVLADRCELELFWGDQTSSILPRVNGIERSCPPGVKMGEEIGNNVRKNIYRGQHTYPSAGTYILFFEDPNRNAGVSNIMQSVSVPFYVQSELVISPGLGGNNSPILTNPPIDDGCVDQPYEHNAGAYDVDDDSLSYRLVPNRTSGGNIISTIYDPQYVQDSIKIDPTTGDLIWDLPRNIGQFNFAFEINEWRQNAQGVWVRIGYVVRDMQITINNCFDNNEPPVIDPVGPFCVEAGSALDFTVEATDPDGDEITLSAFGGVFAVEDPADSSFGATGLGSVSDDFHWQTTCNHLRKQPYYVSFQAKDDPTPRNAQLTSLVDIFTTEITVVAPAPENPMATAGENQINLNWDFSPCPGASYYSIYRRESTYGFIPSECETGVPEYTGYEFIDTVMGENNTSYTDELELVRGVEYCYMVVANFPGEVESYASEEFCASLPLNYPMMTNVDVLSTDENSGSIDVKWMLPPDMDSNLFPPPYSFRLYRAEEINGSDFVEIANLTDTFYVDSNLNTFELGYRYKVEMYFGSADELLGESDPASSVYLQVFPSDESMGLRFAHNTPWRNNSYAIYKEIPTGSGNFIIIDTTYTGSYKDTGLVNGEEYCYKALSIGAFTANDSLPAPLLNHSQESCGVAIDTAAPCIPVVTGTYNCEKDSLYLEWEYPDDAECNDDITEYRVYYKPTRADAFPANYISVTAGQSNFFISDADPSIGCYAVTAVDDAGNDPGGTPNESAFSAIFCAEPCPVILFPNVFTPNGDGVNDIFRPQSANNIGEISITIYNRWGTPVYQTSNTEDFLNTGWGGRDMNSGKICSDGVYYYVGIYTPLSLQTPVPQEFSGFVHLFSQN